MNALLEASIVWDKHVVGMFLGSDIRSETVAKPIDVVARLVGIDHVTSDIQRVLSLNLLRIAAIWK